MGVDAYTTHYQDIWGYGHANGKGQIENSGWTTTTFNSLLTATYAWKISEAWDFDALLGNEIVQDNNKYYWQYGGTYNFPGWNHINNTVTKDNEEKLLVSSFGCSPETADLEFSMTREMEKKNGMDKGDNNLCIFCFVCTYTSDRYHSR